MKRSLTGICLFALNVVSLYAGVQAGVEKIIKNMNPNVNLGIVVLDLTSGDTLYQRNSNRLYIPASNMKLYSEAAALMALGPDYVFRNQLSTNAGQIQHGVLKGNLYLHLSGDPSFSRDDLKQLFYKLKEWNVDKIDGNVIIDSTLSSVDSYPPGWLKSDLSYSYGAPIAPLMLDSNRLTVTVNPGAKAGEPAIVEVHDGGSGIVVSNQVSTHVSAKGCGIGLSLDQENHLTVRGCIGVGQWAVQQRMAIKNPLVFAQGVIKSQLQQVNIQFNGQVQLGKAPAGTLLLATVQSRPLSQLMADTLKPSDNLFADSLYLHAAMKVKGVPVNWKEAEPVVKDFLQKQTGVKLGNAVFTDGSGLSRYNLVTPAQTVSLLEFLYQRFPLSFEYISALPISGRDGTLEKRFRTPNQQGFIRAKTGTMTGINGLSGYLYSANGHTLAFAMFVNRTPGGKASGPGRPLIDALCNYFLQQTPNSIRLAHVFSPHNRVNFLQYPTQGQLQRGHQARWRRLESAIKLALQGQPVSVVYRNNELVIHDSQSDANRVWASLKNLSRNYSFAVVLSSRFLAVAPSGKPMMLWLQTDNPSIPGSRTWIIREAV